MFNHQKIRVGLYQHIVCLHVSGSLSSSVSEDDELSSPDLKPPVNMGFMKEKRPVEAQYSDVASKLMVRN